MAIAIKLDQDAIRTALETISKLAPPTSGNINFVCATGKLKLQTMGDVSRGSVLVPSEVKGDGEFAMPMQAFKDATKGRETVLLMYDNSVLTITAGAYKVELATADYVPIDPMEMQDKKEWSVTAEQALWLRSAVKAVALRATSMMNEFMPVGIKLTSKGSMVACYDTHHMAWLNSKEVTGDFELVLPTDTMSSILEVFHRANFKITQSASCIEIRNKTTTITLSVPSLEDLPTLTQVAGKLKEIAKVQGDSFKLATSEVKTFLDNARAVIGKDRPELTVEAKGKGVQLSVKTVGGQAKDMLSGSGKGLFKIDLEYFAEALQSAGEELEMTVVTNMFVSMKRPSASIIISLNQSSE
jgi:hypothetical protein